MEMTFKCAKIEETDTSYKVFLESRSPDIHDEVFGLIMLRGDKLDDAEYKRSYSIGKTFTVTIEPDERT